MFKKIAIVVVPLIALIGSGFLWLIYLMPDDFDTERVRQTKIEHLPYYMNRISERRGKILAVVTSVDQMGTSGKQTGFEFGELARAYWVFDINGFDVDIASVKGGKAPVVFDDMWEFEHAFLNDTKAKQKIDNTLKIDQLDWRDYQGIYFVGGKGAMFDFPDNPDIKTMVKNLYQHDKVVAAVCHGPAALVNVKLDSGDWLVGDKMVSSFTNQEELLLIPDAEQIFPFLLQDKLLEQGSNFQQGAAYLEQVVVDGNLITGQNPWSVWRLAEQVITQLGYPPVARKVTQEEHSIRLVMAYTDQGYNTAKALIQQNSDQYHRGVVLMYGIIAFMQLEFGKGLELLLLTHTLRGAQES